jgi:hypothetical protein
VKFRATGATIKQLTLPAREALSVSFGVTNYGFATGRVFNDLFLSGEMTAGDAPGVEGLRVILRLTAAGSDGATSETLSETVNANGTYEFRNLAPGSYLLEIDVASMPADFRLPGQTSWPIQISPLQGSFLDLPLAAFRAISGIVFIDRDGNGQYAVNRDEAVKGARVVVGSVEGWTDDRGAYILRHLPAGKYLEKT